MRDGVGKTNQGESANKNPTSEQTLPQRSTEGAEGAVHDGVRRKRCTKVSASANHIPEMGEEM